MSVQPLLQIKNLKVVFDMPTHQVTAVDGISLDVKPGETVGIVGESGSGKSVMAYSLVGLLAKNGHVAGGEILFDGKMIAPGTAAQAALRGREIAFIFQNPRAALNPIRSVGGQICDVFAAAKGGSAARYRAQALELLDTVRIARASDRFGAYPHQLSGGMCQRVLIAMALAAEPRLLIADEPTTGLDVTTQKVVMDIVDELGRHKGLSTILITHDLGLAAQYCQRLNVMSAGHVVETGPSRDILTQPRHAYTQRLVAATPGVTSRLEDLLTETDRRTLQAAAAEAVRPAAATAPDEAPILDVQALRKTFSMAGTAGWVSRILNRRKTTDDQDIQAVADVSFRLPRGGAIGIVGESGSGKTTTARMIARLIDHSDGKIVFNGQDIGRESVAAFVTSPLRRRIQVVFQDPLGSLNPRFTIYEAIRNPLRQCHGRLSAEEEHRRILDAVRKAGLPAELVTRYPHQLSGGQQARAGIARALVVEPDLLILDEPTSALDVSVQAIVLNQLAALRRTSGISLIFVSHDLNVVRLLCETVLVMRNGQVVESGPAERVLTAPQHAYTRSLIEAIPHLPERDGETVVAEQRRAAGNDR